MEDRRKIYADIEGKCIRVIDGDTIDVRVGNWLTGKIYRVRMIGIDAPETKHPRKGTEPYGRKAARELRKALEGRKVYLELDSEAVDRYGRLLAYVYRSDGMDPQATLIRNGLARAVRYGKNSRHYFTYKRYEQEAKQAGRGIWAKKPEGVGCASVVVGLLLVPVGVLAILLMS